MIDENNIVKKEEYYVIEDLDTHMYWHSQRHEWQYTPFKATLREATDTSYERLCKKIHSKEFFDILSKCRALQTRNEKYPTSFEWKADHTLGIAKVTFICEVGEEPLF